MDNPVPGQIKKHRYFGVPKIEHEDIIVYTGNLPGLPHRTQLNSLQNRKSANEKENETETPRTIIKDKACF